MKLNKFLLNIYCEPNTLWGNCGKEEINNSIQETYKLHKIMNIKILTPKLEFMQYIFLI